ncbi:hypothetical protein HDU98_004457 [Podochytrium sp. JEL0797]|nr:hypothetical protein HDU98_004457 [Podochytrium sp. JEL0797]
MNCTDKKPMIKSVVKTLNIRYKLLDKCNIMERQKVVELLLILQERNKNHFLHRNTIVSEGLKHAPTAASSKLAQQHMTPLQKRLMEAVLRIPSLRDARGLVLELVAAVNESFDSAAPRDSEASETKFMKMIGVSKQLENMCQTLEDKTQYCLLSETFREGNKATLQRLVDEISI